MLRNIFPLVIVKDLTKERDFFKNVLDFNIVFEADWYIQLEQEGNQIALMIENSENQPKFLHKSFADRGVVITLEFDNIAEVYKNLKNKAEVLLELKTEEWGQTHFIIKTPGNLIVDMVNYTSPEDYQ